MRYLIRYYRLGDDGQVTPETFPEYDYTITQVWKAQIFARWLADEDITGLEKRDRSGTKPAPTVPN